MWKGLYHHMEKSMSSPQSPADFLSAVREKSQQLEEEMTNHREVPAVGSAKHHHQLGPKQGMHEKKYMTPAQIRIHHRHVHTWSSQQKKKEKEGAAHLEHELLSLPFSCDTSNGTLLYFVGLSPDFCVVASSAEDGSPDGEANHLGESAGSHGDY